MSRAFPLAGLLRVRTLQERAAAERLSRAALEHAHTEARDRQLRASLTASMDGPDDVRTLAALAASRVAARSLLSELHTLRDAQAAAVATARAEHASARVDEHGLSRLAEAHERRERARTMREEQATLDEIAVRPGGARVHVVPGVPVASGTLDSGDVPGEEGHA
jgi:flagellar FliJ protein